MPNNDPIWEDILISAIVGAIWLYLIIHDRMKRDKPKKRRD